MTTELAEIDYDDVIARTPGAICFVLERSENGDSHKTAWIPKSQIEDYTGDLLDNEDLNTGAGSLFVPLWFAEKEGLV